MAVRRTKKGNRSSTAPGQLRLQRFPGLKAACSEAAAAFITRAARGSDPVLAQIAHRRVPEGNALVQRGPDGSRRMDMETVLTKVSLPHSAIRATSIVELAGALAEAGKQTADQQAKMLIDAINRATARTGNVVSGAGRPAFEAVMAALEKIRMDFDGGKPSLTMLVSPETARQLERAMLEWEKDPEKERRWEALMRKKRRAYIARERSRKLVD